MEYNKTISKTELYHNKQLEYLSYFLRYSIYEHTDEKKKMGDICKKIQTTIEQMSFREQIPSIFTSEKIKEKKLDEFLNTKGIPNIRYKNNYQKKVKGFWDKFYLFKQGNVVEHKGKDVIILFNRCNPPVKQEDGSVECEFYEKLKVRNKETGETMLVNIEDMKLDIRGIFENIYVK